jgi:two-component system, LytTR family, response regulator
MSTSKIIKTILVDDEVNNIEYLQSLLQKNCNNLQVIETASNALDAVLMIKELQPQLVFMDIDMPGMTGFEVLKKLEPLHFEVIFVTAYNQYAMEAFDFNAIAYITKPIATEKLLAAVEKAILKIEEKNFNANMFTLLENVQQKNTVDKIALPTLQGLQFIKLDQISYLESSGNYCTFYLQDTAKILVSRQIGEYEKLLPADSFVRIHDKHIINLHCINEYIKGNGGEVILENGVRLTVSSRRKDELLNRFEKWLRKSTYNASSK